MLPSSNQTYIDINDKTFFWADMVQSIDPKGKRFSSIPTLLYSRSISDYRTMTLKIFGMNGGINKIQVEDGSSVEVVPVEEFKTSTDALRGTIAYAVQQRKSSTSNFQSFSWKFFDPLRNYFKPYGVDVSFEGVNMNWGTANCRVAGINYMLGRVTYGCKASPIVPPSWVSGNEDLLVSFKNQTWTDLTIMCAEGATIKSHKLIVATRCPVLQAMFSCNMKENINSVVDLSQFQCATVKSFLTFLYVGKNPFADEAQEAIDIAELVHLAHQFSMPTLLEYCIEHIEDDIEHISVDDRQIIKGIGELIGNEHLVELCELYSKYAPVCIDYNTGPENILGICVEPDWEEPVDFQRTNEGWKGAIPVGKKFKFVLSLAKDLDAVNEIITKFNYETGSDRIVHNINEINSVISSQKIEF